MKSRPIEHCYWVIPGEFLAGEYPGDKIEMAARVKVANLIQSGITDFIDLTQRHESLLQYKDLLGHACHRRFPIKDGAIPESPLLTVEILNTIDELLDAGRKVYVHCYGGIGRTGVIVGCWLARHGLGGKEALDRLRELWKQCPKSARTTTPETREQDHYILGWKVGQ